MFLIKTIIPLLCSIITSEVVVKCDVVHRVVRSAAYKPIDCSKTRSLSPCRCLNSQNDNQFDEKIYSINCTGVYSDLIDLKVLSQRLSDELFPERETSSQPTRYVIEKLVIHNSAVKQIRSNVFIQSSKTISFIEIELIDNKMLELIDKNAFDGSSETLKSLKIVNNNRLHTTERMGNEIWDFVNKFRNLEILKLSQINLNHIPSHAFRPEDGDLDHLKHVEITHNNIHTIEDFAFEGLTAPSLRLWLNNNKISTIGRNALKFKNMAHHVIRLIDLSNNLLTADSFDPQTFYKMGRPLATLILRNNQIDTLYQQVFLPLFDKSEKNYFQLEIGSKQLKCQCSLQWVFTTKYCYEDKSGSVANQIFDIRCGDSDFANCRTKSEQLSSSCLKESHNSAFNSSVNKCLISLNILIVFQLIYDNFYLKFL